MCLVQGLSDVPPPLQLCSMFGLPHTPAWLGWVQENKFKVLFAAFIASNFASRLTSTGAFEVIVDGRCAPVRGVVSVGLAVCIVFRALCVLCVRVWANASLRLLLRVYVCVPLLNRCALIALLQGILCSRSLRWVGYQHSR